jgi:hypothetical protein
MLLHNVRLLLRACNRLAHVMCVQGLEALADALADCMRARALQPGYVRGSVQLASLMVVSTGQPYSSTKHPDQIWTGR